LNATKTAIEFCLADAECAVNETMLTAVMEKNRRTLGELGNLSGRRLVRHPREDARQRRR